MDALFGDLQTDLENESWANALEIAEEILSQCDEKPAEKAAAAEARLYAFVKLGRFTDVVKEAEESDAAGRLLKAYAQYRLGQFSEAKALLGGAAASSDDPFVRNLLAQIDYQQGNFSSAEKVFAALAKDGQEDANLNLACVQEASSAAGLGLGVLKKFHDLAPKQWVSQYNIGSAELGAGQLNAALKSLLNALAGCMKDPSHREEDLSQIRAQLGVVYQKLNQEKQATANYEKVAPSSSLTNLVVTNNQMALKVAHDTSKCNEAIKKITNAVSSCSTTTSAASSSSTAISKTVLDSTSFNKAALLVMGKKEAAVEALKEMEPSSKKIVLEASQAFLKKDLGLCEQILIKGGEGGRGEDSAAAVSALGEFYSTHLKDEQKAIAYYSKLPADQRLAALDTLCAFAWKQKKPEEVLRHLREAMESVKADAEKLKTVLQTAFKWAKNHLHDAAFQQEITQLYLEQIDKSDAFFLQQRVFNLTCGSSAARGPPGGKMTSSNSKSTGAAGSATVPPAKDALEKGFQLAIDLFEKNNNDSAMDLDFEELEQQGIPTRLMAKAKSLSSTTAGTATAGPDGQAGVKKKRNRKPRYPKDFDPKNPDKFPKPDPERWLPKQQRSYYKAPKGKRGNRNVIKGGPQGAVTGGNAEKTGPSTLQNTKIETEVVARKANKNKKKKK